MVEQSAEGGKRERSPGYPAIGLEEAITKVRKLYREEGRSAAPIQTILKHWDYKAKSGGGLRAVAALEKFGLIVSEGSGDNRKARLSEDAWNILVDDRRDSSDRLQLIQEAALKPPIHIGLWEQFGKDLPSEDSLKFVLRKIGFTEAASKEFIEEYRSTLEFAKLGARDILTPGAEDKPSAPIGAVSMQQTVAGNPDTIKLPIAQGEWALLQAVFPMAKEKWEKMMEVLEAMESVLTTGNDGKGSGQGTESE